MPSSPKDFSIKQLYGWRPWKRVPLSWIRWSPHPHPMFFHMLWISYFVCTCMGYFLLSLFFFNLFASQFKTKLIIIFIFEIMPQHDRDMTFYHLLHLMPNFLNPCMVIKFPNRTSILIDLEQSEVLITILSCFMFASFLFR